jgi:hypothetical protein
MANPLGKQGPRDKPYRDALRMEVAAAGADHRLLREIARAHLELAKSGDMHAIREMADRLDGKPAQESMVTIDNKRDGTDWSRNELVAILNDAKAGSNGAAKANGRGDGPDSVH